MEMMKHTLLSLCCLLLLAACGKSNTEEKPDNSGQEGQERTVQAWSWTFSYAKGDDAANAALAEAQPAWAEEPHRLWSDQGREAYIHLTEDPGKGTDNTAQPANTWTFYNGHPYVKGVYWQDAFEYCVPVSPRAGDRVQFSGSLTGSGSAAAFFLAEYSTDGGASWQIADGASEITVNGNTFPCHSAAQDAFTEGAGDFNATFTLREDAVSDTLRLRLRVNVNYRITRNNATQSNPITLLGSGSNRLRGSHNIIITPGESEASERTDVVRLLYWNIQYGMWADQGNNYDNFVAWVKEMDPDICVWCEAASKYDTGTYDTTPAASSYLPGHWGELAARYGHSYSALGGHHDRCPQEVTSRYPIETLLKITTTEDASRPIAHGAGLHQVSVKGRKINILTAHLWPKSYAKGTAEADQSADAAAHGGDYYRQFEMQWLVKNVINNSEYAGTDDWLLLGDFNSYSRKDNFHYAYADDDTRFLAQDAVLEGTSLKDVVSERFPGIFVPTHLRNIRIDYVYASAPLFGTIKSAEVLGQSWAPHQASSVSPLYEPSDHKPIVIDFKF